MRVATVQRRDFFLTGISLAHYTTSPIQIISATSFSSRHQRKGTGVKADTDGDVVPR